ncbi:MAG: DUF1206 domain-containing protein [Nocardioidaceae bacterium]
MDLASGRQQARQLSSSVWLERTVRLGLVSYGVVHLLIAWLALQLAFGHQSNASQQGALHALARQPFGTLLLWLVAVGLLALAVWQVTEALLGHTREDEPKRALKRVGSAGKAVVYAAIGISAAKIAVGSGSSSKSQALTARLMDLPFGRLLVAGVGVVILVVAVVHAKRSLTTSFKKDLEARATSGSSGTAIVRLGQVGYLAKAVAFAVLGGLFVWAAWTYDAKKAGGLDAALSTLLGQGVGPWLLVVVALGIGCFGLYCFAWARYADTSS